MLSTSTTTGDIPSGVMSPPLPVIASKSRCSRASFSVTSDSVCSYDAEQSSPVKLDTRENSLLNYLLSDSLADISIASTLARNNSRATDLCSPNSLLQPDSEPDSFSLDDSNVSNYYIRNLFSNSLTNQSSTPVEPRVVNVVQKYGTALFFPSFPSHFSFSPSTPSPFPSSSSLSSPSPPSFSPYPFPHAL